MLRVRFFVLIAMVSLVSLASPGAADQIPMQQVNLGADFAFIDSFLNKSSHAASLSPQSGRRALRIAE